MDNVIWVALITGLTAGGLSCYAVQGGLLSGSIAHRLEAGALQDAAESGRRRTARGVNGQAAAVNEQRMRPGKMKFQAGMLQPILLFMAAKLAAYTVLGFLLGLLGSTFQLTPRLQGAFQLAIGVFLVGNALRMLNVHPIFRYFSFEPPSSVTRYIRKVGKQGDSWVTPVFLGLLTVLIPCGVTQSMMAVAVGTGSPLLGALILFAFVIGTSPTFVGVSWLATSLAGMFQKSFNLVVAAVILGLGLWTLNSGLVLIGSPISATRVIQSVRQAQAAEEPVEVAAPVSTIAPNPVSSRAVEGSAPAAAGNTAAIINVENHGYKPDLLTLPAGQPVELHLVTNNTRSCSRAFVIPDLDISEMLPATGDVVVMLPPQAAGTSVPFMCSMGMYTGVFQFK